MHETQDTDFDMLMSESSNLWCELFGVFCSLPHHRIFCKPCCVSYRANEFEEGRAILRSRSSQRLLRRLDTQREAVKRRGRSHLKFKPSWSF